MAVTYTFTIGGRDYTTFVDIFSMSITDTSESQGDVLAFDLVMDTLALGAGEPGSPEPGQIVAMSVDEVKQFEGVLLRNIQEIMSAGTETVRYRCSASDYTYLLSRKLVTGDDTKFPAGLAGDTVKRLIAEYAPGFGTRYVRPGFEVPADEFDHTPLGSVLNKYAQAVGFTWYVDFDRELHFSEGEVGGAPVDFIDLDTELRIGDIIVEADTSQIRNRVYVKDATTRSAEKRRETYIADGVSAFYRQYSPAFSDEEFEVFLNDAPINVLPDPLTSQQGELEGPPGTCFVCILNAGVRFNLGDVPEEGDELIFDYYPEDGGDSGGIIVVMEDPDSIRMLTQRESSDGYLSDGVHEVVVSVPDLRAKTLDPLSFIGGIVLDRQAWPEIRGEFTTYDLDLRNWRAGQSVTLKSVNRDVFSDRLYWRTGQKDPVKVYVSQVSKSFKPAKMDPVGDTLLFEVKINFNSVPARKVVV